MERVARYTSCFRYQLAETVIKSIEPYPERGSGVSLSTRAPIVTIISGIIGQIFSVILAMNGKRENQLHKSHKLRAIIGTNQ